MNAGGACGVFERPKPVPAGAGTGLLLRRMLYAISLQPAADILHIALHALNEQSGVEAVYVQASIISSYTLTIIAVYLSASRK